jgi:hypothetical protein
MARYFTVSEANALLPTVRQIVERMVELRRQQESSDATSTNGGAPQSPLRARIAACLEELERLGVQVKDLDTGLVDFPALRDGEEILLCWRLGEDEVAWWHTLDGGFAGRQPI